MFIGVNFGEEITQWNCSQEAPDIGFIFTNLLDLEGNSTGIGFRSDIGGSYTLGDRADGTYHGFPETFWDAVAFRSGASMQYTFSGLTPYIGQTYTLKTAHFSNSPRDNDVTFDGVTQQYNSITGDPVAPLVFTGEITGDTLVLNIDPANGAPTTYLSGLSLDIVTAAPTLVPDTQYYYRVRAVNATGASAWSNVASGRTTAPSGWRANEPAGMTWLEERTFDTSTETGWWGNPADLALYDVLSQTSPAPTYGSSNVGRFNYLAGTGGGGAPGSDGIDPANSSIWTGSNEVYLCFEIRFSPNWQGHATGTNKIFFLTMSGHGGNGDPCFLSLQTTLTPPQLMVRSQGTGDVDVPTSAFLAVEEITYGDWHLVEVHLVKNSTASGSDGSFTMWVNGVKTQEDLSCNWANTAAAVWDSVRWEPTWGGSGDTVAADMYQEISRIGVGVKS